VYKQYTVKQDSSTFLYLLCYTLVKHWQIRVLSYVMQYHIIWKKCTTHVEKHFLSVLRLEETVYFCHASHCYIPV